MNQPGHFSKSLLAFEVHSPFISSTMSSVHPHNEENQPLLSSQSDTSHVKKNPTLIANVDVEAVEGAGGVDDEVKGEGVAGVPVVLAGSDEAVGAHLARVGLLGAAARDGPGLGAEGLGEHDGVVAEAADADDATDATDASTATDAISPLIS